VKSWDEAILAMQKGASLVAIARQGRLVLEDREGPRRVELCWVDEVALALIDLSITRGQSLDLVYPAPAGEVAVLLAAQLLIHQFVHHVRAPSVGLVTADTTMATKTWEALRIATAGGREPISRVFPCFRAGPSGESPWGGRRQRGIIIGQKYSGWPVDNLIVDHLAGFVEANTYRGAIEVFADPVDPSIRHAEEAGHLIWGWSDSDLAHGHSTQQPQRFTVPFSVASERLETIGRGVDVTVVVCRHEPAEAALTRVRSDLRLLRSLAPQRTDRNLERGLTAAWHHLTTLISLPCTPSQFDRFAGVPPIAARATRTFERELEAWANTLTGDVQEIATTMASDIGDLRACLDEANPFEKPIFDAAQSGEPTLLVTRTATASKALLDVLARRGQRSETLTTCAIGRLHRQGTWGRAIMVGEPSPWDWHRLLSGIASRLNVLALGDTSAASCARSVSELRMASDHWGDAQTRGLTWRALVGTAPPPARQAAGGAGRGVIEVDGSEYVPEPDPFESLASLFDLDPLDIGGEGPASGLVREGESEDWTANVAAVEVTTDHGRILLESDRPIEIRVGPHIVDKRPEDLTPGDIVLVGRNQGRVGLIEALEERLGHRQDLLAARLLVDGYRSRVRRRFVDSGLTLVDIYDGLTALGCDKTTSTMKNWILGTTMAPQQVEDLQRLNRVLELGMSPMQLRELFGGVQRRRGFRRSAGRALAAAARDATVVENTSRVDVETGLSVADLRDAVIQAVVRSVRRCPGLVPFTLLGRLEP
jgi:hypothetical protein